MFKYLIFGRFRAFGSLNVFRPLADFGKFLVKGDFSFSKGEGSRNLVDVMHNRFLKFI